MLSPVSFYYGVEINATFKDTVFRDFVKPIVKVEHPLPVHMNNYAL